MIHQLRIVSDLPVNAVCLRVTDKLVDRLSKALKPSWSVLDHAEEEHVMRGPRTLTADLKVVAVPCLGPLLGVGVDGGKEEMMQEPDVRRLGGIQTVVYLEIREKVLPLLTKAVGDIVPEALNTGVVDAPEKK